MARTKEENKGKSGADYAQATWNNRDFPENLTKIPTRNGVRLTLSSMENGDEVCIKMGTYSVLFTKKEIKEFIKTLEQVTANTRKITE